MQLESDPWCSSGVLAPNGDLVVTGGYNKGIRAVRIITPTPNSQFKETINVTASDRWYVRYRDIFYVCNNKEFNIIYKY